MVFTIKKKSFIYLTGGGKVLKFSVLCIVGLFCSICSIAQNNILSQPAHSAVMAAIYNYDSNTYAQSINQVTDKAVAAYLAEYQALMIYTASNSDANYNKYMKASDKALSEVEKHQYEPTLTSNLQLHRCLVELSNGSMFGGGVQFWKSYRSFKRGEEKLKNYDGQLMLRAIFDILLSQVPEKWKGLAGLFGFGDGNLEQGFAEIDEYHKRVKNVPGLNEESLLLTFANIFLSHDQRISEAQRAELRTSNAPVVVYAYLLSCGRKCMGEEADDVLSNLDVHTYQVFPLMYHQRAKYALRRLDTAKAKHYADEFISIYTGFSCRNDAPLIKAYALLLEGKKAEAEQQAKVAISTPYRSDVDKRTYRDAEIFSQMHPTLLKARFQFEYGNYVASLETLKDFVPTSADAIEHAFRTARAEEKLLHTDEALRQYDKTISLAGDSKRYFGPYAAVYAADIMLSKGNKIAAKRYIAVARKLNNGEFSKEIDQRCELTERAMK